jgi:lambda repressor-like predicted transcriptional regulator
MVRKQYNLDGNMNYPDTGCVKAKAAGYHGKCLDCPFPQCLEDPGVLPPQREETIKRNAEMGQLSETGWTVEQISKHAGLSARQTQRIISGESETGNSPYKRHRKRKDLAQRNLEIRKLKKEGMTIAELSIKFGLCDKQVWAVCRGC